MEPHTVGLISSLLGVLIAFVLDAKTPPKVELSLVQLFVKRVNLAMHYQTTPATTILTGRNFIGILFSLDVYFLLHHI